MLALALDDMLPVAYNTSVSIKLIFKNIWVAPF